MVFYGLINIMLTAYVGVLINKVTVLFGIYHLLMILQEGQNINQDSNKMCRH